MTVKIGWFNMQESNEIAKHEGYALSPFLQFEPERYKISQQAYPGRWKFTTCPAHINFYKNMFIMKSPVTASLKLREMGPGMYDLEPETPEHYELSPPAWNRLFDFVGNVGPDGAVPTLQLRNGLTFVADEPCTIQLLPAFNHVYDMPGELITGEFDIHAWQRSVQFSLAWRNTKKALRIKRGEPLFYVKFVVHRDPTEKVELVKLKENPQLLNAILRTQNTPGYIRNVFQLFDIARKMRPKKFITKENTWKPGD
jgi:hypothetical protein